MSGFVALPPPAPGLPQLLVPPPAYEGFSLPTLPPPPPPPDNEYVTIKRVLFIVCYMCYLGIAA